MHRFEMQIDAQMLERWEHLIFSFHSFIEFQMKQSWMSLKAMKKLYMISIAMSVIWLGKQQIGNF